MTSFLYVTKRWVGLVGRYGRWWWLLIQENCLVQMPGCFMARYSKAQPTVEKDPFGLCLFIRIEKERLVNRIPDGLCPNAREEGIAELPAGYPHFSAGCRYFQRSNLGHQTHPFKPLCRDGPKCDRGAVAVRSICGWNMVDVAVFRVFFMNQWIFFVPLNIARTNTRWY